MKKIRLFFLATIISVGAVASNGGDDEKEKTREEKLQRVEVLSQRVHQIKGMEFSELDKQERAELKDELRSIKKELKDIDLGSPVSMSLGLLIIIILLLIIIL